MGTDSYSLDLESLGGRYAAGARPSEVVEEVLRRIQHGEHRSNDAWLSLRPRREVLADAIELEARRARGDLLPFFGIPFGVKDSFDVVGLPTTVACPALSRVADESAPAVLKLQQAGALLIGKTNMDQLATGLVGVRSPYGIPVNPFDARMIPGGSSSGSAVAVAGGQVSFTFGTDTAGSGRVPAAFNNVVGLKPTRGMVSMRGVAPACRSIDCFSVFALTADDAWAVLRAAAGHDAEDPFSRREMADFDVALRKPSMPWRIGVPRPEQLEFFGDADAKGAFDASIAKLVSLGMRRVEVDFAPFREAGALLYGGPWVAERLVLGGKLLAEQPDALLPVIREILSEAMAYDAVAAYSATYKLAALKQVVSRTWDRVDAVVVPTTPTVYSIEQVARAPRALNSNLGVYTTFANLLDLAAIAVPGGFRRDDLPVGVTVLGPAGSDANIVEIARAHHGAFGGRLGATVHSLSQRDTPVPRLGAAAALRTPEDDCVPLAVVGAHLRGQPLNSQLTELGARFVRTACTAPHYRLFNLLGAAPPKPGLVRNATGGRTIDVEVWDVRSSRLGQFLLRVKAPLCIGSIELEDGSWVHGFLCEAHATEGAEDISSWGGWRGFLTARGESV
jgi:allophanate hydrolase